MKDKSTSEKKAQDPEKTPPRRRMQRFNRRSGDVPEGASPPWLVSFTDIMALMLTFFVLLYAMSQPEEKSWSEVMAALQKEFHVFYGPRDEAGPQDIVDVQRVNYNRALPLDYLSSLLERLMEDNDAGGKMTFRILEDTLIISLPEEALFESASTDMQENAVRQLNNLGTSLSKIRNRIEIVGHSDPAPITNPRSEFPSNWELSLERATAVAEILKLRGYTQPIIIKGYSSARFDDMKAETTQDLKEKYSRRVDILILPDDGQRSLEQRLRLE